MEERSTRPCMLLLRQLHPASGEHRDILPAASTRVVALTEVLPWCSASAPGWLPAFTLASFRNNPVPQK